MSVRTFIFSPQFFDAPGRYAARREHDDVAAPTRRLDPADQALVARVREGTDEDARTAFDALYARAYDQLVRFAMRLADADTAHDIVQDVFVSLWTARTTWQAPAGSLPYFYSAVRNRALKRIRHAEVVRDAQWYLRPDAPDVSPAEHDVETAEFEAALFAVLAELPERRRTAFWLRTVDGLGYDAIGAVLGISGPAAYKQISTAVRTLRERLARFAG